MNATEPKRTRKRTYSKEYLVGLSDRFKEASKQPLALESDPSRTGLGIGLGAASRVREELGPPMDIEEAAAFIGFSPWSIRQTLIPLGLPVMRSGPSGKFVFYRDQLTAWIIRQQKEGGIVR